MNARLDTYQVMFYRVQKIGVTGAAVYHFAAHTHVSNKQALIDQSTFFIQASMYRILYPSSRTSSLLCKQAYQHVGSCADEAND